MFKIGDTVRNVARDVVGDVVDIDGDMVYLEQPNGCEVNFVASVLVLESDYQKSHDKTTVRADAGAQRHDPVYDAVLERIFPAVIQLGQSHHAAQPRVPGVAPKAWDELSALQKINAVSAATDVPVKAWIDAAEVGAKPNIGALQLSVLAKAGKTSPR